MRLVTRTGPVWLGYGSNVVPAEDAASLEQVLRRLAGPLARRLGSGGLHGVGLHLTDRAARELLEDGRRLESLRTCLCEEGLHPYTVNAFPVGGFHAARVKEAVYRPDWTEAARLDHTLRVARVHAALLPEGETGTLSTVAGAFVRRARGEDVETRIAANLVRAARALAELREETGRRLVLCPEPEPLTTLETTDQVLAFWERRLDRDDPAVRDHLALCFDCCHQAVEHEDLPGALARLAAAGIPIGKVQLSSALEADPRDEADLAALRRLDEPRWLHQVVAPDLSGGLARAADLPEALAALEAWRARVPWRIHFHVPIERETMGPLRTTRAAIVAAVRTIVERRLCDHLEVETYTWSVLPGEGDLLDGLEREMAFARRLVQG